MGSPSRNVQYHPPRLSEDRLNLPQPHSPSLPTHCTAPGNRECAPPDPTYLPLLAFLTFDREPEQYLCAAVLRHGKAVAGPAGTVSQPCPRGQTANGGRSATTSALPRSARREYRGVRAADADRRTQAHLPGARHQGRQGSCVEAGSGTPTRDRGWGRSGSGLPQVDSRVRFRSPYAGVDTLTLPTDTNGARSLHQQPTHRLHR